MPDQDAFILLGGFEALCRNPRFILELRQRELTVLLVTPSAWRDEALRFMAQPDHPASAITDVVFVDGSMQVEGSFTASVVAGVAPWLDRYRVVGVYAFGEVLVEQAGILADWASVPSPGLRATRVCRSKYLQRLYLAQWSPRSVLIPPAARPHASTSWTGFPAVLKPAGRHSSSGVQVVLDQQALLAALDDYPPSESLLIEERIDGPEFSVEALVQDEGVLFESVTEKRTNESTSSRFVELAHTVAPLSNPSKEDALLRANREVLGRLAFSDGVAHGEYRVDRTGRVMLMEIAARTPGDGLTYLYHLATGQPLEPTIIDIALGRPASYPRLRRCARQVYLPHASGLLSDVSVNWPGVEVTWIGPGTPWPQLAPRPPGVAPRLASVLSLKERGSALAEMTDSDSRAVSFLIDTDSRRELDDLESQVTGAVRIHVSADGAGH